MKVESHKDKVWFHLKEPKIVEHQEYSKEVQKRKIASAKLKRLRKNEIRRTSRGRT